MNSSTPTCGMPASYARRLYHRAPHLFNILIIECIVLVVYGACLTHDFAWDDVGLIVNNPQVKDISGAGRLFLRSFWQVGDNVEDATRHFYRPLISLSYAADYRLWRLAPAGYHLTNLVGHGLAAALAYALALALSLRPPAAVLAAILFAVHPTHVENVGWIAGRTDVFCAVFYFLAMIVSLRLARQPDRGAVLLPVVGMSYFAALLSKETAITFPLVVLAHHVLLGGRPARRGMTTALWVMLVLLTAIYWVMRSAVLGAALAPASSGAVWERLASIPMVFAKYLGSLASLLPQDPHHDDAFIQRVSDARFAVGVLVSACYAGAFVHTLRHQARQTAFLLAWIPLTLAPTFNLGAFGDVLRADRFLYIPSFAFAVLASDLVDRAREGMRQAPRLQRLVGLGVLAMAVFWGATAMLYARLWRNNLTLFSYASETSPRSTYILYNLGNSLAASGDPLRAIAVFRRVLDLDPDYKEALTNLGVCLAGLGRHGEALQCFQRALELGDGSPVLFSNAAHAYRCLGDLERAIAWYQRSLAAGPTASAHNNLGECLLAQRKPDLASEHFKAALQLDPSSAVYNNLAMASIEQGRYAEAIQFLERALAAPPPLPAAVEIAIHYNLARSLLATGERQAARLHAQAALSLARTASPEQAQNADMEWLLKLAETP